MKACGRWLSTGTLCLLVACGGAPGSTPPLVPGPESCSTLWGATLGKPGTPVTFTPSVDVAALPVVTLVGSGEVAATLPVSRTGIAGQYQFLMPFGPLIRGSGTLTVRVNAGSVNCGSTALQIIGLGDTDAYQGAAARFLSHVRGAVLATASRAGIDVTDTQGDWGEVAKRNLPFAMVELLLNHPSNPSSFGQILETRTVPHQGAPGPVDLDALDMIFSVIDQRQSAAGSLPSPGTLAMDGVTSQDTGGTCQFGPDWRPVIGGAAGLVNCLRERPGGAEAQQLARQRQAALEAVAGLLAVYSVTSDNLTTLPARKAVIAAASTVIASLSAVQTWNDYRTGVMPEGIIPESFDFDLSRTALTPVAPDTEWSNVLVTPRKTAGANMTAFLHRAMTSAYQQLSGLSGMDTTDLDRLLLEQGSSRFQALQAQIHQALTEKTLIDVIAPQTFGPVDLTNYPGAYSASLEHPEPFKVTVEAHRIEWLPPFDPVTTHLILTLNKTLFLTDTSAHKAIKGSNEQTYMYFTLKTTVLAHGQGGGSENDGQTSLTWTASFGETTVNTFDCGGAIPTYALEPGHSTPVTLACRLVGSADKHHDATSTLVTHTDPYQSVKTTTVTGRGGKTAGPLDWTLSARLTALDDRFIFSNVPPEPGGTFLIGHPEFSYPYVTRTDTVITGYGAGSDSRHESQTTSMSVTDFFTVESRRGAADVTMDSGSFTVVSPEKCDQAQYPGCTWQKTVDWTLFLNNPWGY